MFLLILLSTVVNLSLIHIWLVPADLALAMSHVNSEPRGALGFATPARAFRAMLGEDASALMDAFGMSAAYLPVSYTHLDVYKRQG